MKTPRMLVAAVAGAALLLSGCGTANTAAIVDGHRITQSGLQEAAEQIAQYAPQPMPARDVLTRLIIAPTVLDVLGEREVTITDAAARSRLADIDAPVPYVVELTRLDLAIGQMTQEDFAEITSRLGELDVDVNPRYGEFNADQVAVVPATAEWIVSPAG